MCRQFNSLHLIPFAKEVFSYEFKEKPNYNKLRFLLEKNLLDKNTVPNKQYDWNTSEYECALQQSNYKLAHLISNESILFHSHNIDELFLFNSNSNAL